MDLATYLTTSIIISAVALLLGLIVYYKYRNFCQCVLLKNFERKYK